MPVGGIFGALFYKYLLVYFTRRTSLFFIAIWMLISVGLVQITTIETLVIGRFLEGICVACYVSVGPIYLREIVARQLRPQVSAIFSLCKVIGIVIAYTI
jgi:predicted MFS family arabinose efflux permease